MLDRISLDERLVIDWALTGFINLQQLIRGYTICDQDAKLEAIAGIAVCLRDGLLVSVGKLSGLDSHLYKAVNQAVAFCEGFTTCEALSPKHTTMR